MPGWRKLVRWALVLVGVLLVAALLAAVWGWSQMRGSLPQLDGERAVAGLSAPVKVERDALGVPTISGATRTDVARALGFLHAQDRFFQMDLLRRRGAGELSELFGHAALDVDRDARLHGFRRLATKVIAQTEPAERALLTAYTAGVNAGLAALPRAPWEYLVIRAQPQAWREEDTLLCFYAMWFDLQDYQGRFERNRDALRTTLGVPAMEFLAPRGNSWDAPLDGTKFPAAPLPPLRFEAPAADAPPAGLAASEPATKRVVGSNAMALSGVHTATGAGLLANDMHLDLNLPQIWYRAVLQWTDQTGPHRMVGVTLPGTPLVTVGSNGQIAWGFTVAYIDSIDLVAIITDNVADTHYRGLGAWVPFEERTEEIKIKGEKPVSFTARWTQWGPLLEDPKNGHGLVLRWTAHDPESTNLHFLAIENAQTAADAVAIGHRSGIPNVNMVIADRTGNIAWTVAGSVPRRIGYDGRLPVSWSYGDRRWDGYLPPEEIPTVANPETGILWNGNNRTLGDKAYALLGDSGYDDGARSGQIRDGLKALIASGKKAVPADLLAIQLDDRALFLGRWQKFLLGVLTDDTVSRKKSRSELRDAVRAWNGHASADSIAYRIVRAFRIHAAERAFGPFADKATASYAAFNWHNLPYEDALWQLVNEKPEKLLNPEYASWNELLLAAVDDVSTDVENSGGPLARFTWGARNTLAMQHPFGRFLPKILARMLDMPGAQLPGDSDMPRVQGPRFGQSERLVVSPGHEDEGLFQMPGGQSGHPLSPYYRAGHDAWVRGEPAPLLPGPAQHTLTLKP